MKNRLLSIGIIVSFMLLSHISLCFAAMQHREAQPLPGIPPTGTPDKVLIVVNSSIYDAIYELSLKQYVSDLTAEGYNVTLTRFTSGSAQELKDYITFYFLRDLKGVIFIGDLPVPEFEIPEIVTESFKQGYTRFPIDLFYMDLDGEWLDTDNNGVYDTHNPGLSGDLGPEIWLGRLTASLISNPTMDEAGLLKNYFSKNYAYRRGNLSITHRGLYYPDDVCHLVPSYLDNAYSNVKVISDMATTTASDYKTRLKENYEWIHLCVHSGPACHGFDEGADGLTHGYVYNTDIQSIDPTSLFYTLKACSNCKYNYADYMGGHYIFTKTNGLAAVGSTKEACIFDFPYFYTPLGQGLRKNMGEAFKNWLNNVDLELYKSDFYGMTLLGDPTLSLDPPIASINSISPSPACFGQTVTFSGSGNIRTGNITAYSWRSSINGSLYSGSQSSFSTNTLSPGTHIVYFKVKDNKGRWSSEAQAIRSVLPNRPPVLTPIGNQTVNEGSLLQFTVTATDPDNDALTYSASSLPTGASFNATTRKFSWTPTYDQAGVYHIRFAVPNRRSTASKDITIIVKDVNRKPVIVASYSPTSGRSPLKVSFSSQGTYDPDKDKLTYLWNFGDGKALSTQNAIYTYKKRGTYKAMLTVTDAKGAKSTASFTITVK